MEKLRTVFLGVVMFSLLALIPMGCSDSDSGSPPVPPNVPTNRIYILTATGDATLFPAVESNSSGNGQSWEYTLTLEDVSENVFWFSDKPERDSGNETAAYFFETVWPEVYVEIAPNAILEGKIPDEDLGDGLFLTLRNPVYDSEINQVTFDVTLQNSTMTDKHPQDPVTFEFVKMIINDNNEDSQVVKWSYGQVGPLATLAPEGTEGKYILSFENIYPECYYMSNAPDRYSFVYTVELLTETWNNHFGSEAPNASITSYNADGELQVNAFTIENPVYDGETGLLTYTATLLDNSAEPDEYLYNATLFIDAAETDSCGSGFTGRMVVKNGSPDPVWMVPTLPGPPGSPSEKQWGWWKDKYGLKCKIKGGEPGKIFCIPDKGAPSGNFKFFMGCDDSGDNCKMGIPSGDLSNIDTLFEPSFGCKNNTANKDKIIPGCAFNPSSSLPACKKADPADRNADICGSLTSSDWVDMSAVNGFTVPMYLEVTNATNCVDSTGKPRTTTDGSMLDVASCATEDKKSLYSDEKKQQDLIDKGVSLLTKDESGNQQGCAAPKFWFDTTSIGNPVNPVKLMENTEPPWNSANWYGCAGAADGGPGNGGTDCVKGPTDGNKTYPISLTNFVKDLKSMGYKGYTWAYDDGVGLFNCNWGGTVMVTVCPNGGTPYDTNTKWAYKSGKCSAGKKGSYKSLIACQQANMHYKCEDQQIDPDTGGPTYKYCIVDPQGTMTWEACQSSCKN
ncbi:MAG: hypothetical protein HN366_14295 [Deltaproteobacteria bacterium]|jgi:hypothetical protein|nr:hypothetical protein [Deltaproteobacteria bacterium]